MPSVPQGQGTRTHSAQLASALSWMKSRNPSLGLLLVKLVQRHTCLWTSNPISWVIKPGRIWKLLCLPLSAQGPPSAFVACTCRSKGECWEQLVGSEWWTGKSPPAFSPHWQERTRFLPEIPQQITEQQKVQIPARGGSLNTSGKKRFGLSCSHHHISTHLAIDTSRKERCLLVTGWTLTSIGHLWDWGLGILGNSSFALRLFSWISWWQSTHSKQSRMRNVVKANSVSPAQCCDLYSFISGLPHPLGGSQVPL